MNDDDLMTRAAICREYGRDKRTVERRLIGIEPAKVERRGSLLVRYWRRGDVDNAIRQRSPADELAHQMERLNKAKADKAALERGVRSGELVEINVVFQQMAERLTMARSIMLTAPARLAPEIEIINATRSAKDAQRARTALLRRELERAYTELSRPLFFEKGNA